MTKRKVAYMTKRKLQSEAEAWLDEVERETALMDAEASEILSLRTLCKEAAALFDAQSDEWGRVALLWKDGDERKDRCRAHYQAGKEMAQRLREAAQKE